MEEPFNGGKLKLLGTLQADKALLSSRLKAIEDNFELFKSGVSASGLFVSSHSFEQVKSIFREN